MQATYTVTYTKLLEFQLINRAVRRTLQSFMCRGINTRLTVLTTETQTASV